LEDHEILSDVLFSPVYECLKPAQLADWILEKQLNVRLQVQLHKILWGDEKGK
jgi:7-carboxy-7-deazaguanine synthase